MTSLVGRGCRFLGCCLALQAALLLLLPLGPSLAFYAQLGYVPETSWPGRLPHLLWDLGPQQTRRPGRTPWADASQYQPKELTEEEKRHYFERGWVLVKGALPPSALTQLRSSLLEEAGAGLWPWSINTFLSHDSMMDFYLFSPLGYIASQLYGGGEAFLFSDFLYFREPGQKISDWHTDGGECAKPSRPANFTSTSRVRAWVTLDDKVPAPILLEQSLYLDLLSETEQTAYWRGELGMDEPAFYQRLSKWQSTAAFKEDKYRVQLQNVSLGDILLHSPCLLHKSPSTSGLRRMVGFLCPSFMPANSRHKKDSPNSPHNARRQCRSGLDDGALLAGNQCFPRVFPPPEHLRGREMHFEYVDNDDVAATSYHWYKGWVGRRYSDMFGWKVSGMPPYAEETDAFVAMKAAAQIGMGILFSAWPGGWYSG